MRLAVIADIHANLQAWQAVIGDIDGQEVDSIINLGDLVGYGPNPLEVCLSARSRIDCHLLGNHDAAVCGRATTENWNDHALHSLRWTRQRMTPEIIEWFRTMPIRLSRNNCGFVHAEFSSPESFYYVADPKHAIRSWRATQEQLLFIGHTHRQALFVTGASGASYALAPRDFVCEPGKRYLAGVGSVGFSRHLVDKASYCIFDSADNSVTWREIDFDYQAYAAAVKDNGLVDPR